MAREVFGTHWVKLEVIGDDDTLQPDVVGLIEAARILTKDGFDVFPYTTEDLVVAERLLAAGCRCSCRGARRSAQAGTSKCLPHCARCGGISPASRWWSMPASGSRPMRPR